MPDALLQAALLQLSLDLIQYWDKLLDITSPTRVSCRICGKVARATERSDDVIRIIPHLEPARQGYTRVQSTRKVKG